MSNNPMDQLNQQTALLDSLMSDWEKVGKRNKTVSTEEIFCFLTLMSII